MPKFYAGGADKATGGFFLIMEDLSENYTMVWTLDPIKDLIFRSGSQNNYYDFDQLLHRYLNILFLTLTSEPTKNGTYIQKNSA